MLRVHIVIVVYVLSLSRVEDTSTRLTNGMVLQSSKERTSLEGRGYRLGHVASYRNRVPRFRVRCFAQRSDHSRHLTDSSSDQAAVDRPR